MEEHGIEECTTRARLRRPLLCCVCWCVRSEGKEWRKVAEEDIPRVHEANEAAKVAAAEMLRLQQERDLAEAAAFAEASAGDGEVAPESGGKVRATRSTCSK
jgi:hypothetical protein